jgi:gas vesicle protein
MSCHCQKDCHCQQNSSFIFGIIIGLIIAAVVATVIYKNNRQDVFIKLKKQLEKFFDSLKPKTEDIIESFIAPDLPKKKILKKKKKVSSVKPIKVVAPEIHKKEVTIPDNLIVVDTKPKASISKPRKMFKK